MPQPAKVPGPPTFDAELLRQLTAAIARRGKAIRFHAAVTLEREFTETPRATFERLTLDVWSGAERLRLTVWDDGELWLCLCVAGLGRNSGWAFRDEFRGSVLDVAPEAVVGMVDRTRAEPFRHGVSDPVEYREQVRRIWESVRVRSA